MHHAAWCGRKAILVTPCAAAFLGVGQCGGNAGESPKLRDSHNSSVEPLRLLQVSGKTGTLAVRCI